MNPRALVCALSIAFGALLAGCDNMPGKPEPGPEVPVPSSVVSFDKLYAQNCSGCHGDNGQRGAAIALNDPQYLALVDDAALKDVISHGYKNGLMPGFSASVSGMLTEQQINALVSGLRTKWGKGNVLAGLNAPQYADKTPGDVAHGGEVYATSCANCHGAVGTSGQKGSILNGSYLALMNPQSLRTIVIVGRPEWGMPDWRSHKKNPPLTNQQVTDVVAWLQSQTPDYPGQPYASSKPAAEAAPPANGQGVSK